MGTFVKICGLACRDDVEEVGRLGPDAMGFVFWRGSKRYVDPGDVLAWTRFVPPSIRKVGVFVDAGEKEIRRVISEARLGFVQLHGDVPMDMLHRIRTHVWKAVHLDCDDPEAIRRYHVDAYIMDSYTAESPGGTGQVGDWNLARQFVATTKIPVLLAGGLTPENVEEAIRQVRPWGVDVSSGVEARPGKKDMEKVRTFIERCRKS